LEYPLSRRGRADRRMVARQNDLICIAIGSSSPTAETVHNGGSGAYVGGLQTTWSDDLGWGSDAAGGSVTLTAAWTPSNRKCPPDTFLPA
jgi:hypothetical protein